MRVELARILSNKGYGWRFLRMATGAVLLLVTGCATSSFNPPQTQTWLPDGSLSISRPIPKPNLFSEPMAQPKLFSDPRARMRAPTMPEAPASPRLVIDTTTHTMALELPGESPVVIKAHGAYAMKRGAYAITLKQTDPLWYAPPTYFLRRGIKVPPEGSRTRFMKGALGHQALVLDKQIAIHTGPVWTDEIGGIKVSNEDMARLFETVTIGTKVEIR